MKKDTTVKILICYHKPDQLFSDDILTPIHVGRAQAKAKNNPNLAWLEENMIGDDTGENISDKNYCYNELTATYWAYKNYAALGDPDYVGLMHYRRHFIFNTNSDMGVIEFDGMDDNYLSAINYSEDSVKALVKGQDIVYYKGKVDNIYKHYCENHIKEDLDLSIKILGELSPEYLSTAKEYIMGDTGCFCNMAIFSKKLYFEYCDFLFPILEKFMSIVDMSEKRFFISERLTGIFIAQKIKEGKKTLSLASSFVKSEYTIPVVMPLIKGYLNEAAVTISSLLQNKKDMTKLALNVITNGASDYEIDKIKAIIDTCDGATVNFFDIKEFLAENKILHMINNTDLYPFFASELIPGIGKFLYITHNALFMKDIEEFFRTCSVDDFWIVGAGKKIYGKSKIYGSSIVLNGGRLRQHSVFKKLISLKEKELNAEYAFETLCKDQVSVYPDWFWVDATSEEEWIINKKSRMVSQADASWRTQICYAEETHPLKNIQATYSVYWWNALSDAKVYIPLNTDHTVATNRIVNEHKILNSNYRKINSNNGYAPQKSELSLIFKIKRYYRQFGLKSTIKRLFEKLTGR